MINSLNYVGKKDDQVMFWKIISQGPAPTDFVYDFATYTRERIQVGLEFVDQWTTGTCTSPVLYFDRPYDPALYAPGKGIFLKAAGPFGGSWTHLKNGDVCRE